jgi:hypothetical protein
MFVRECDMCKNVYFWIVCFGFIFLFKVERLLFLGVRTGEREGFRVALSNWLYVGGPDGI